MSDAVLRRSDGPAPPTARRASVLLGGDTSVHEEVGAVPISHLSYRSSSVSLSFKAAINPLVVILPPDRIASFAADSAAKVNSA